MSITAPPAVPGMGAPSPGLGGGGGGDTSPPGQSSQLLQQVQNLLAQIMQNEPEPAIQRAVSSMLDLTNDLSKVLGRDDQQDQMSGLNTPGGAMPPPGVSDNSTPSSFAGAKKAAMANYGAKGHFSKSGSKGEQLQSDKTKNRLKGGVKAKG